MSKKKWVRPSETPSETPSVTPEIVEIPEENKEEVHLSDVECLGIKRNKMFDFAGDLSLIKTPIVATQIFNHTERSAIFTVTFTDLTEQEMETLIKIGNEV